MNKRKELIKKIHDSMRKENGTFSTELLDEIIIAFRMPANPSYLISDSDQFDPFIRTLVHLLKLKDQFLTNMGD